MTPEQAVRDLDESLQAAGQMTGPAPNGWDEGQVPTPDDGDSEDNPGPKIVEPLYWPSLAYQTPPEREWIEQGWMPKGHPLLCAGLGGSGKTLLMQQMASYHAVGRGFIHDPPRPLVTLFWACEDDRDELWRRQAAIADHLNARLEDFGNFHLVPRMGEDNVLFAKAMGSTNWTSQWTTLKQQVNDLRADMLIVDNVNQTCAELIDTHAVTKFVNGFNGIRPGLTTVLIAHPAKSAGSEWSGSQAWENAVRTRWYLGATLPGQSEDVEEDTNTRYLCKRKSNYSAKDFIKLTYTDGVFTCAAPDGTRYDAKALAVKAQNIVMEGLQTLLQMNQQPTDARNGSAFLPRLLIEYKLNQGMTKKDLASAMRDLQVMGKIKRGVVGQYQNRTPKYGLMLGDGIRLLE